MRITSNSTHAEMEATFLRDELTSRRLGPLVERQLMLRHKDRALIEHSDVTNDADNRCRHEILLGYRGPGCWVDLFSTLPNDIAWKRAVLTREDLGRIKYVREVPWISFSDGTRHVVDGASAVRSGRGIADMSPEVFWNTAEAIKAGKPMGKPILVGRDETDDLVLLEGHQRMTAYCLLGDDVPNEIGVVVGFSPRINEWAFY
jgi:hypothetical protein